MNSSRIAVIAASVCSIAWAAKAVAIGLAGGLDKSPAEGPLFLAGFVSSLVAVVALAISLTRARPVWARALAGVGAVVGLVALIAPTDWLVHAILPGDHWVVSEAGLWLCAAVLLAVTLRHDRRPLRRDPAPRVPVTA